MKEFFKYTLATVVGIFLTSIVMFLLAVISIAGLTASESATQSIDDNSVLVIQLKGALNERADADLMASFSGNSGSMGLDELLSAIKKAKKTDEIKGIYIEAGALNPDSYASLQTLRKQLLDFKKSGKWIVAYGDTYTQQAYYICSLADKLYLNPEGMIDWHGIASNPMFFKDIMAKFGVKMQLVKVGNYKSAPEMYVNDKMSDFNREQITAYITGIWNEVCQDVAASRKLSVEKLNEYADNYITFADQKTYITNKMVDKLLYRDEVRAEVKKMLGIAEDENINQLTLSQMKNVKDIDRDGEPIAIYYAYGDIVDDATDGSTSAQICASTMVPDIEALAKDDDIKAVVLRINSGGGSAYASEQIWHAIEKLKEKKPVVVSMGGMAASGGYYIASGANWIIAEPTTITGSIGIFGMFPDFSELLTNKLGIKFDLVKTNTSADFGTISRALNEQEYNVLQSYVDRGYTLFRKRVADGRKMKVSEVENIAQGRVWLGKDAKGIKLVDQLGSIGDAVKKAAKLAKLEEYHTVAYPGETSFFDKLMSMTDEESGTYLDGKMKNAMENELKASMGDLYEPLYLMRSIQNQNPIQARMPYFINMH